MSVTPPPISLVTAVDIAARLGEPLRRVQWILATRHHIRPAALAGVVRIYSTQAIALVQDELDRIEARRRGVRRA
jgi:hypothetical protein